jgi:hypothetical protein
MKLTRAIVACDLNKHYLDFWPVVHESWNNIIGIPCTLVLIADHMPEELAYKEDVILFKPIPGIHTAFTAQCIRLLYPCLLKEEGVILSDMDMIPTYKKYFVDTIADLPADTFYSYRGIHHHEKQIWICYVVAHPSVWKEIFKIDSFEDIAALLKEWNSYVNYEGKRGGEGWFADQEILYDYIVNQWEHPEKLSFKNDEQMSFRHLDRNDNDWQNLNFQLQLRLKHGYYQDFHMPSYAEYSKQIMDIYNFMVSNSST